MLPFTQRVDDEKDNYEFKRPFENKGLDPKQVFEECGHSRNLPALLNSKGYEVVGDKLPDYIYNLNFNVIASHPDLYIIMTIRDVRTFIKSSTRHYNAGFRKHWCFPDQATAEKFWIDANIHLINAFLRARMDRLRVLKYETVCEKADRLVADMSAFVDFEFQISEPSNLYFPVHKTPPHYNLTDESLRIMELFGYDV